MSDILLAILKLCDDEPDEAEVERQRQIKMEALRKKILLVGKLSRMYGAIRTEREAVVKLGLSDGKVSSPSLQIGDFKNVKIADKANEMRPTWNFASPPRGENYNNYNNNNNNNNNNNDNNK